MKENTFSIKENNVGCKEVCPICGDVHKASINNTIFDNHSGRPICRECQEEHAPILRGILDKVYDESEILKGEYIQGIKVKGKRIEYEFDVDEVFNEMIERINMRSDLDLTKEHLSLGVDDETNRFHFVVNEDAFSLSEWDQCAYNLNEWFETFDLIIFEIFGETFNMASHEFYKLSHYKKYDESDDVIVIVKTN